MFYFIFEREERERETERARAGEGQREKEIQNSKPLRAQHGFELMNREIMTSAEVRRLTN